MPPSRTTKYRQQLKLKNPEKYKQYLEDQKLRNQKARESLKQQLKKPRPKKEALEKKKHQLCQGRDRQRRYVERLREKGQKQPCTSKKAIIFTRSQEEIKREKNRLYKQRSRQNQSSQKKAWIRMKERLRQRERRANARNYREVADPNFTPPSSAFGSKQTEWNATTKARKVLPNSPNRYAKVISNLARKCSPRKKKAIENLERTIGVPKKSIMSPLVRETLVKLKNDDIVKGKQVVRKIALRLVKKYSKRVVSVALGISRHTLSTGRLKKRPRSRKFKIEDIHNFYKREDISRILPQKRYATKEGPGYLMQVTVLSAQQKFLKEHPEQHISYSRFAKERPKNVRLLSAKYREYCVCTYCINVRFKLLTLRRFVSDPAKKHSSEGDLMSILLCPKPDSQRFHDLKCVQGSCSKCCSFGENLERYFNFSEENLKQQVVWNSWKKVTKDGKTKRKLITIEDNLAQLMAEFIREDIMSPVRNVTFVQHLFTAQWQYHQYLTLKENLPRGWLLQVMDFAKNRGTMYEGEIKGAFYSPEQITMHPIVSYYHGPEGIVRYSVIVFSDDINHDYHAVNHFHNLVNTLVLDKIGHKIRVQTVFSDGCSCQYKSSGPFADLSLKGHNVIRCYYGSEHGKGEGDGEIGILNRALDRAICSKNAIINNAEDAYLWCTENFMLNSALSKRSFVFVKKSDINHDRPYTCALTVPQTRKIHQARNKPGEPYYLYTRELACFCTACNHEADYGKITNPNTCKNLLTVGPLKKQRIRLKGTDTVHESESKERDGEEMAIMFDDIIEHLEYESSEMDEIVAALAVNEASDNIQLANYSNIVDSLLSEEQRQQSSDNSGDKSKPDNGNTSSTESQTNRSQAPNHEDINIGTWVAVIYDDIWLPGTVEEIKILGEEKKFITNFMKSRRSTRAFYWPSKPETDTLLAKEMLCLLKPPFPVNSRGDYQFNEDEEVNLLLNTVLGSENET